MTVTGNETVVGNIFGGSVFQHGPITGSVTVVSNIFSGSGSQHGYITGSEIISADVFSGASVMQFPGIIGVTFDNDIDSFDQTDITWDS